jgi:hypothetical protein
VGEGLGEKRPLGVDEAQRLVQLNGCLAHRVECDERSLDGCGLPPQP